MKPEVLAKANIDNLIYFYLNFLNVEPVKKHHIEKKTDNFYIVRDCHGIYVGYARSLEEAERL